MVRKEAKLAAFAVMGAIAFSSVVSAATIDFSTDDNSQPLANGQLIDTEFFTNFTISTDAGADHLGATIFDSSDPGPNDSSGDPDLLVNLGNILMLQNPNLPTMTVPGIFDTPDDFAGGNDEGTYTFSFVNSVELTSIDLVDINGGVMVDLVLTDGGNLTRTYNVPTKWTNDIDVNGPNGYDTLFLNTLAAQDGEGTGGDATAFEDAGFDSTDVTQMTIRFYGSSPSGGIDNLVFVPEPSSIALLAMGSVALLRRRR